MDAGSSMTSSGGEPRSRVLFVDDEPNIIDGLRRMLHPYRDRWDMTFVTSPEEALRLATEQPFDVVVSDMRMPGMSGAELLERIRAVSSSTVRIILSGHSEVSAIMKSVGPSHQFLSKPCNGDAIEGAVARACALRTHLGNPDLAQLVGKIETLPSLPAIYTELMRAIDDDASIETIGKIISRDIGMTAKVLKLINSSYFGMARTITEPAQAAGLLGTETLQTLVLGAKIFEELKSSDLEAAEELWEKSSVAGAYARRICLAEEADEVMTSQSVIAALLHDVGLLIARGYFPELLENAQALEREEGLPQEQAERAGFGATHGDLGAYLLGLWGFPDPLVEAVAFHHCPGSSLVKDFAPLAVVHVAQALAHHGFPDEKSSDGPAPKGVDQIYLDAVGKGEQLSGWIERCLEVGGDGSG